jgi:hypothetical protein
MNGYYLIKQIMAQADSYLKLELECRENTFQNGHVFVRHRKDGDNYYIYRCNICGLLHEGTGLDFHGNKNNSWGWRLDKDLQPDNITCDEYIIKNIIE